MADIFQAAAAWLTGQLKSFGSRQVEYRRGAAKVTLRATVGRKALSLGDEFGGSRTEWTDADFTFSPADLGAIAPPPARGDVVADTVSGVTYLYEVRPFASEPPWRWSDPHKTRVRVHCKYLGVG